LLERSIASLSPEPHGSTEWYAVEPRVSPILWRSMSSMLRTRGFNDAVQSYVRSHGDELGFNLARIPDDFDHHATELFDRNYMQSLFERGYAMAKDGYPWLPAAPGW